jgi:hypothetical protein
MRAGWYSNAWIRAFLAAVLLGAVWVSPFRLRPPVRRLSYRQTAPPNFLRRTFSTPPPAPADGSPSRETCLTTVSSSESDGDDSDFLYGGQCSATSAADRSCSHSHLQTHRLAQTQALGFPLRC